MRKQNIFLGINVMRGETIPKKTTLKANFKLL